MKNLIKAITEEEHEVENKHFDSVEEVSKTWSADDWETYLTSLDGGIEGLQLDPQYFDDTCENLTRSIFDNEVDDISLAKKELISKTINSLSEVDRKIIENIFFHGLSEAQVAESLKISQPALHFRKIRILVHLKNNPIVRLIELTYMKGKNKKKPLCPVDRIDSEYQKGKITKDEKYRLWALHEVGALRRFVK